MAWQTLVTYAICLLGMTSLPSCGPRIDEAPPSPPLLAPIKAVDYLISQADPRLVSAFRRLLADPGIPPLPFERLRVTGERPDGLGRYTLFLDAPNAPDSIAIDFDSKLDLIRSANFPATAGTSAALPMEQLKKLAQEFFVRQFPQAFDGVQQVDMINLSPEISDNGTITLEAEISSPGYYRTTPLVADLSASSGSIVGFYYYPEMKELIPRAEGLPSRGECLGAALKALARQAPELGKMPWLIDENYSRQLEGGEVCVVWTFRFLPEKGRNAIGDTPLAGVSVIAANAKIRNVDVSPASDEEVERAIAKKHGFPDPMPNRN
jgi:hypothetical protein